MAPLASFLSGFDGRVLIAADSPGRREVLQDMLKPHTTGVTAVADWAAFAEGEARLALTVAPDVGGLLLMTPRIAVLSESQLFGARASQERRRRRSASDPQAILRDLTDLNPGSPVVHEEYGVGPLRGDSWPWKSPAIRASSWCSNTRAAIESTCRCTRCT